jgi:hypothetical protein
MMPLKQGRCLVWDKICPDTLAPSRLNQAVIGPGVVATAAEASKRMKCEVISRTYKFSPIAIETFGALGEIFKDLAARIKNVTEESRAFEFLMQRLNLN